MPRHALTPLPHGYGVVRQWNGMYQPLMAVFADDPDGSVMRWLAIGPPVTRRLAAAQRCLAVAASPRPQDAALKH